MKDKTNKIDLMLRIEHFLIQSCNRKIEIAVASLQIASETAKMGIEKEDSNQLLVSPEKDDEMEILKEELEAANRQLKKRNWKSRII
ncbi:hypothetical protein FEM48_Zijuj05G0138600 [Ziziphus jujuba var. spinosa]|uniref:Uncharacterized protein n=1 Tax=Ziziphus jujuba var. spinosa TaxID=714518 RepID=A0A978VF74_ZIZJJ|nr:hypothetical protein FEM48_Zijuj05G0138600 [Ziziphus jujuba var. spinosa]